jgi:hypothetical protein
LGKHGVLTDPDPYDLPTEAFSLGVNVRFRNGKVTSGPVFRTAALLDGDQPRYTFSAAPSTGLDSLFVGYQNGTVSKFTVAAQFPFSVSGYTPSVAEAAWTNTTLANVIYVNREDRPPWYLRTIDSAFQDLSAAGWGATWTTKLLRSCAGALVALNVTKGGIAYPQMVKTSSLPTTDTVPASWDQTNPATLATENILAEMQGPIVDAANFGNSLIIYGLKEAWLMQADNSIQVYSYTKLPFQKGALNVNCSLEIDGKMYVFGSDDIWVHDTVGEQSLCEGKVRDFIYSGINLSKARNCFMLHNPQLKEITFAYVSGDRAIQFDNPLAGCNRQAVYNYVTEVWSFDDLPQTTSACNANLNTSATWASMPGTWDTTGGSWLDFEDSYKRTPVYVGQGGAFGLSTSMYAFDLYGPGSTVLFPVSTAATKRRYLERDGIDLDEVGLELRGYKTINSLYPQARLGTGSLPLQVSYGASDYFNVQPTFSDYQIYDGAEAYKLDYNTAGRYLSMKLLFDDYKEMTISGFDLDIQRTGNR